MYPGPDSLRLDDVQEVLEEEVYQWAGARYAPKTPDLLGPPSPWQ